MGFFNALFFGTTDALEKAYDPDKSRYMFEELEAISRCVHLRIRADLEQTYFSPCGIDGNRLSPDVIEMVQTITSRDFGKIKPSRKQAETLISHLVAIAGYAFMNTQNRFKDHCLNMRVEDFKSGGMTLGLEPITLWDHFRSTSSSPEHYLVTMYPKRIDHYYKKGNGPMNSKMWGAV